MDNYKPHSVSGQVFQKLGKRPDGPEGNLFGPWNPETYEVEDSAFGLIKMQNGATIFLEASWAINLRISKEASTTLCGTKAGAEINSGSSYPKDELIYNRAHNGLLTEESLSPGGAVAYFDGGMKNPSDAEAHQWLKAVLGEGAPLVKPEQAFVVTTILDAIYRSAESGKEILF